MGETKDVVNKMVCFDLAEELGELLGVNPVWDDEYVVYGLGDDLIELSFDLDNGGWTIATDEGAGDYGIVRLPNKAPELMAEMSEIIEGIEDDLGGKVDQACSELEDQMFREYPYLSNYWLKLFYSSEDFVFDPDGEEAKLFDPDPLGLKGRPKEEKK